MKLRNVFGCLKYVAVLLMSTLAHAEIEAGRVLTLFPGAEAAVELAVAMNGSPAPVKTVCRIRAEAGHLTFRFECEDDDLRVNPDHGPGHPDLWKDDSVEVFLDVGHRHEKGRRTVRVQLNAAGVGAFEIGGEILAELPGGSVAAQTVSGGWQARIAIPWDALGGHPAVGVVWGMNLARSEYPRAAYLCWSPTGRGFWNMDRWGHLVFAGTSEDETRARERIAADHEHAAIRQKVRRNPFYSPMPPDLAGIGLEIPGSGGACVWTADGEPSAAWWLTADGAAATPQAGPQDAIAVGAVWPIPHVIDRVRLTFDAPPEAADRLTPEVFDGRQWIAWTQELTRTVHASDVELTFEPVVTERLRLAVADPDRVKRLEVRRYLAEADALDWPRSMLTAELAQRMLDDAEEPSFEALRRHALSMPAWASIGTKDTGYEQAVAWDGQLHCHGRRIFLSLGDRAVRLGLVRDTIRRRLMDGWRPGVILDAQAGDWLVRQTAFCAFMDEARNQAATFVRVELTHTGTQAFSGPVSIEVRDAPRDPFEGTLGVEIFNPPADQSPSVWDLEPGLLLRNGRPFLVTPDVPRRGPQASDLVWDLDLEPGETRVLTYAVPVPPWDPTPAEALELARLPFNEAQARFVEYWDRQLAPAMTVEVPEPRLNHLFRAVLAQIFISGYGDILPYGAAPSNYDGSVYGVEEGYSMFALAFAGFGADAQRYMQTTYLQPRFFTKAEVFERGEDRNQQNHNGIKPLQAIELYRLTRDRAWIGQHLAVIRECAEWTIANRRKTMQLVDGRKPLHYGLLPEWAWGGDVQDLCHPLYPNFSCWRGLNETAWLMDELGDTVTAQRYREEADDYRGVLLDLVDSMYRRDAVPPFLPLRVEATEPDSGDFYQLAASLILDLLPFAYDDPRSAWLSDFIEQDNRTLCLLARFRRQTLPGGIDGIYAKGHLLSLLHRGRIREFLLGFYAFQVFNMEHTCFTSREQTMVYASDRHLRTPDPLGDWSDPLPASSAVAALLLRHLLVTEETPGAGEFTGRLLLLSGAPRRWFEAQQSVNVQNAVTAFGTISFDVTRDTEADRTSARITLASDAPCTGLVLRLPHPRNKPITAVTVDGQAVEAFDSVAGTIRLDPPRGTVVVTADY